LIAVQEDVPDVIVPKGSTAVVDGNLLRKNGSIVLEPDDKNLRAELNAVTDGMIFLDIGTDSPFGRFGSLGPEGAIRSTQFLEIGRK